MRMLGNILWHVLFLGFINAFLTLLVGGLLVLTVVAAPIGFGLIELANFLLAPFTRAMAGRGELARYRGTEDAPMTVWEGYSLLVAILYFPFGLILAAVTVVQIVASALSIVGLPVAYVLAKSLTTYLNPVGKECISVTQAQDMAWRGL
jgi:uncharacterized membrane protein YccF (DUF307 family)